MLVPKREGAGATGLEPATSGVTGRRSNQLSYAPGSFGWASARRPGPREASACRPRVAWPMRLVTYDAGDGPRAGVLEDGRVVDAWALLGEPHRGSLRELIADGRVDDLRGRLGDTGAPSHPRCAVSLLPPIPDPEKIVCIGLNYRKHAAEARDRAARRAPTIFAKYRNALAATGRHGAAAGRRAQGRLRGRGRLRRRPARQGRRGGRGARPHRRLHAAQRPLGPRPAVRDPAVDAGQGLRRLRPLRAGARHPGRGRARTTRSGSR